MVIRVERGAEVPTPKTEVQKNTAAASKPEQKRLDRLELSRQALEQVQKLQKARKVKREEQTGLSVLLESAEKETESQSGQFRTMALCQKIAARIRKGDKVPIRDQRYLMENDPELYRMSILLRQENKHPQKYKSLLKKEDKSPSEKAMEAKWEALLETQNPMKEGAVSVPDSGGSEDGTEAP